MARITYGKMFRTKNGRYGRYKYLNGRRVGFVSSKPSFRYKNRNYWNK